MPLVYLSLPMWKNVPSDVVTVSNGTLDQVITELESRYGLAGLKQAFITSSGEIKSNASVYTNVQLTGVRLYDSLQTRRIKEVNTTITDVDGPLLLSIFESEAVVKELLRLLSDSDADSKNLINVWGSKRRYQAFLATRHAHKHSKALVVESEPEAIYGFTLGQSLSHLCTLQGHPSAGEPDMPLLSETLAQGIANVIGKLQDNANSAAPTILARLRLFQQELLHAMVSESNKLKQSTKGIPLPILLSVPTGGGKTEAFIFGLLAILEKSKRHDKSEGTPYTRALIVYPTRALANDQVRRIAEILYQVNAELPLSQPFTIGILTGDTPNSSVGLQIEDSPLQNCPRCESPLSDFGREPSTIFSSPLTMARCRCGAKISFFRFSRQDILTAPPDLIVTSPDMINRMLQSPAWRKSVFTSRLETLVWDEAHVYGGAFGCHVAHTLRRVEEALGRQPLYVALSATIANPHEMAALLFNIAPQDIRLLRAKALDEKESSENRPYIDFSAGAIRYRHHWAVAPALSRERHISVVTAALNTVDALGHAIRAPHFRKTLIFGNSRRNVDNLVSLLRDHEERYFLPFMTTIWPSLKHDSAESNLSEPDIEIASAIGRWFNHFAKNGTLYSAPLEFGWHRAGLEVAHRLRAVNRFMATQPLETNIGESPWPVDIMVATSTLELGIDIGDVTTVVNCGAPRSVSEYVQRVGRAGRRKDSLALTIIDPTDPLDFHFLSHFEEFAHPQRNNYEAIPLVISNTEITRRHLWARLLDFVAQETDISERRHLEITVGDLKQTIIQSTDNDRMLTFGDSPEDFANSLFDSLFSEFEIRRWNDWRALETLCVPDSFRSILSSAELREWWVEKLISLHRRLIRGDVTDETLLTGIEPFDPDLVPSLRNIGTQVAVLQKVNINDSTIRNEEKALDVVSRYSCVENNPSGAYIRVGAQSYQVDSLNEDEEATLWVRRQLRSINGDKAVQYFHQFFDTPDSPFPTSARDLLSSLDISMTVPGNVEVSAKPNRYHCSNCGSTYDSLPLSKGVQTPHCINCMGTLRQLTEIYSCGRCGRQKMPPVPKVCSNPACIELARSCRDGLLFKKGKYENVGRSGKDSHNHNDFFRFDALPFLHWRCRACGTITNYHATYKLPLSIQNQVLGCSFTSSLNPSTQEIAKRFLLFPESWPLKDYEANGFARSWFECKACRSEGSYRKIHVINLPNTKSILHEYWLKGQPLAPMCEVSGCTIAPYQVKRLALARERFSRFWSHARRQWQVVIDPIYTEPTKFLTDGGEVHALYFDCKGALLRVARDSQFPLCCNVDATCHCHEIALANSNSKYIEQNHENGRTEPNDAEIEIRETDISTRPRARLSNHELNRVPDPRRHWCHIVKGSRITDTKEQDIICPSSNCMGCKHFESRKMRSYLALHTLKHAILLAAPRFCGASRGQLRGVLNPNDENEFDLMISETTEGGAGVVMLLYRNWEAVMELAGEILQNAVHGRGSLLLSHGCSRFNCDLCPGLGLELWQEITQSSLGLIEEVEL